MSALFAQFGQAGAPYGDHALRVPKFRRSEQPARVREVLLSYHRMRDAAAQVCRDFVAEGAGVEAQWGALQVLRWLDACIAACESWLSATARRGGRGLPPPGCRGGAPAVMGHGCPASSSAVGPAPGVLAGLDITPPADPLLLAQRVQELPWNIEPINNRPHGLEAQS